MAKKKTKFNSKPLNEKRQENKIIKEKLATASLKSIWQIIFF